MGRRDKRIQSESIDTLGAKLRLIRQRKGVSLTEMARLLRYSKSYLSAVENGSTPPSKDLIQGYERILGLAPGELTAYLDLTLDEFTALLQEKKLSSLDITENARLSKEPETREDSRSQKIPFDEALLLEPVHFVGRTEDITWLMERLKVGGTAGITALRGLGGIGKTSLAAIVVRKLHEEGEFPDGIAVILCQDLKEPTEVLQRVLSRFDPHPHNPETKNFADLSKIAYQLLHGKKLLIVLDNIRPDLDIEQVVVPLRNAGATLLLTSRHILSYNAVPTNAVRKLGLLSSDEALELFAHSLGKENPAQFSQFERETAQRIINALDRHTFAVKLSGIYAANLDRDLETLATLLENPQKAFESVEDELPQTVKRIFDRSFEALPEETQLLFCALAAFETVDFSRNAAIALLSGLHKAFSETRTNVLSETHTNILVRLSLIDAFVNDEMPRRISDRERLRLHPLLRALAVAQFEKWPEERRHRAYHVVAEYYASYAIRLLNDLSDPDGIAVALDPDVKNMTASLEWAYRQENNQQVMAICSSMQCLWNYQANTNAVLHYSPWGIAAAEKIIETLPDERLVGLQCLARLTLVYGYALQLTSEVGTSKNLIQAQSHYEKSLALANEIHDQQTAGVALYRLGRLSRKRGNLEKAETYYQMALPRLREIHNQRDEGWTLAFLGQIKHDQGDLQEAKHLYEEALAIHRNIHFRRGEGWIIGYLGRLSLTYYRLDDTEVHHLDDAETYYRQYLEIAEQQQDRHSKGICLSFLGEIALAKKKYDEAEKSLREARDILHEVHDTQSEGWILHLLGQLALEQRAYPQAEALLNNALDKLGAISDPRAKNLIQSQLARIPQTQDDHY